MGKRYLSGLILLCMFTAGAVNSCAVGVVKNPNTATNSMAFSKKTGESGDLEDFKLNKKESSIGNLAKLINKCDKNGIHNLAKLINESDENGIGNLAKLLNKCDENDVDNLVKLIKKCDEKSVKNLSILVGSKRLDPTALLKELNSNFDSLLKKLEAESFDINAAIKSIK